MRTVPSVTEAAYAAVATTGTMRMVATRMMLRTMRPSISRPDAASHVPPQSSSLLSCAPCPAIQQHPEPSKQQPHEAVRNTRFHRAANRPRKERGERGLLLEGAHLEQVESAHQSTQLPGAVITDERTPADVAAVHVRSREVSLAP